MYVIIIIKDSFVLPCAYKYITSTIRYSTSAISAIASYRYDTRHKFFSFTFWIFLGARQTHQNHSKKVMPVLTQLLAGGLSLFAHYNGTEVATASPDMVPQYALARTYSSADCSGEPNAITGSRINSCFKNSFIPGTYNIKCDANKVCDMYTYNSMDCSGPGKPKGRKATLNNKCQASDDGGSVLPVLETGTDAAMSSIPKPATLAWQTGDDECSGAPSTVSSLGICRSDGRTSYQLQCDKSSTISMCQFVNSTSCTGFQRCEKLPLYNPTKKCISRKHFGGAASVEFVC